MRHKVLAAFLALTLVLAAGCGARGTGGQSAAETIKIGVLGPHTGKWAVEGQGFLKAVKLLAEEVNAQGGVMGKQVEILELDDKGEPQEGQIAARKAVDAGAVAVIGSYASSVTEPAQQILMEAGILHITPASTATRLTQKGYKLFFRTIFLDDRQGQFAARFITETLGKRRVAILHDNSTYAKGLAEWTRKYLEERGAEVVFFDAITPGESDYKPVLTRVKAANPEVLYWTGYHPEGALLARQGKELGLRDTTIFIYGDANNNTDLIKLAGDAAEGLIVTTAPLPQDLPYPEARQFIEKYRAKYHEDPPSIYTLTAADAFRLIVHAIEQTQSTDPQKLAEFLHQLKDFPGITGPITFDEKGDREGQIHTAYVVKGGQFVLYAQGQ